MKRNQTGFGAIEALLFLILLSILGFTGYYVYHAQKSTDNTYDSATKTSNSTPVSASSNASSKFVFKEIGVEIPLTDTLKGLSYYISPETGYSVITTNKFKSAYKKCSPSSTANPDFAAVFKKSGRFTAVDRVELLKQFKDFYIAWAPNLADFVCDNEADEQATNQIATDTNQAVRDVFKSASLTQ